MIKKEFNALKNFSSGLHEKLEWVVRYAKLGWQIVPLKGKTPFWPNWTERWREEDTNALTAKELMNDPSLNLGVLTGVASNVVAIDVDEPELVGYDPKKAIELGASAHTTSRGIRLVFKSNNPQVLNFSKKLVKDGNVILEILGTGRQFLAPPSIHPEKKIKFHWIKEPSEKTLEIGSLEELKRILFEVVERKELILELFHPDEILNQKEGREGLRRLLNLILDKLEVVKEYSNYWLIRCPFHPPDHNPSFAIYKDALLAVDFHDGKVYTLKELKKKLGIDSWKEQITDSIRKENDRESIVVRLIEFVRSNCQLFTDGNGEKWIAWRGSGFQVFPLRSEETRGKLAELCYEEKYAPSSETLSGCLNVLSAFALKERKELNLRWAWVDGKLYCDPGWPDWRIIEIDEKGWRMVEHEKPVFYRSPKMGAFPQPDEKITVEEFKRLLDKYINCKKEDRVILYSALVVACFPQIEQSILNLIGKPGSGKTSTAEVLKSLIDPPGKMSGRGIWRDERDLALICRANYLIFLDNLDRISGEVADQICRLITGGIFETRRLYTDSDLATFSYKRGLVITSCHPPSERSDFLDRCLIVKTPELKEKRGEKEFWDEFGAVYSKLFGGLLCAISKTIKIVDQVEQELKNEKKHRLGDWHVYMEAASRALGFEPNKCHLRILELMDERAKVAVVEDAVGELLIEFLEAEEKKKEKDEDKIWEGTASELLVALKNFAKERGREIKGIGFPRSPNTLSRRLKLLEDNLKSFGYLYEEGREGEEGKRIKTFKKIEKKSRQSHLQGSGSDDEERGDEDDKEVRKISSESSDRQKYGGNDTDDTTDDTDDTDDTRLLSSEGSSEEIPPYTDDTDDTDDKFPIKRGNMKHNRSPTIPLSPEGEISGKKHGNDGNPAFPRPPSIPPHITDPLSKLFFVLATKHRHEFTVEQLARKTGLPEDEVRTLLENLPIRRPHENTFAIDPDGKVEALVKEDIGSVTDPDTLKRMELRKGDLLTLPIQFALNGLRDGRLDIIKKKEGEIRR